MIHFNDIFPGFEGPLHKQIEDLRFLLKALGYQLSLHIIFCLSFAVNEALLPRRQE